MNMKNNTHLIIFIIILQFLSGYAYAQSAPQQTKEEKKKAEQEKKAQEKQAKEQQKQQEKQAKIDAKAAKDSAPVLIQKEYDRFTDQTTVKFITPTSRQNILEGVKFNLGVAASFLGTTPPPTDVGVDAILVFSYRVDTASPAGNRNLILLVDNRPIDFGQLQTASASTQRFNARVVFTDVILYAKVPLDFLRKLSNAQTIEGRFNGIEFQVSPKFIPTLQNFFKP
jgi:hypothetical protein